MFVQCSLKKRERECFLTQRTWKWRRLGVRVYTDIKENNGAERAMPKKHAKCETRF
jgi:hypothetical protein